jgi:hypothetical protein
LILLGAGGAYLAFRKPRRSNPARRKRKRRRRYR